MRTGRYFIVLSWKETVGGKDGNPDSYRNRQLTIWQKANQSLEDRMTEARSRKRSGMYEEVFLYYERITAERIPVL